MNTPASDATDPLLGDEPVVIDEYGAPGDREAFDALNRWWLEAYFHVEPEDLRIIEDPDGVILSNGGRILMARLDGVAIGTAALIPIDEEACEFAKMGVDPAYAGRGIGRKILEHSLELAKASGYRKMLICTSSTLGPANHLYRSVGFVPSRDPRHHSYERADVFIEKIL